MLGLRRTVGSYGSSYFPPDYIQLIHAANQSHHVPRKSVKSTNIAGRMSSRSTPILLSVAGRARAKHAHRGMTDRFFGASVGNNEAKNKAAEEVVKTLLREAVWINIHVLGAVKEPIFEVRNKRGYGARWSAEWRLEDGGIPQNVRFRGFLEPHVEDGFQKRWRHE